MAGMAKTSYLRVYQGIGRFSVEEQGRWLGQIDGEPVEATVSGRWLVKGSLPRNESIAEGAFLRRVDGEVLVCPWRIRLRMLAGMLAFREALPDEVADAFVPEIEASRAARELAAMDARDPAARSHILHSNWHVPLRWFAIFDGDDRILVEDGEGLRIRYETELEGGKQRLRRALRVLEGHWGEDEVTAAIRELDAWLGQFQGPGLVELDYGTVGSMFEADALVEDRSAEQVWACLEALEAGDLSGAAQRFSTLTEHWAPVRVFEVAN
jgi:hypothetical protein